MLPGTRRFAVLLAAIATAGLAVRIAAVLLTPDLVGAGDFRFYHWTANLLAETGTFSDPFAFEAGVRGRLEPVEATGEPLRPTAAHPPLWPGVLAAVSALGAKGLLAHRLAGAALGALVVVLAGLLGRRVAGDRAGLVSAALAAAYPVLVAADASLLSETLLGACVVGALLVADRLRERPAAGHAALLGVLAGLAVLTRAEALLLLPLLLAAALWRAPRGGRLRVAGLACAAAALTLAPWVVRNLTVFERPVLISTNDGTVLAGANCADTYAGPDLGSWRFGCIDVSRVERDEGRRTARWREDGLGYAADHPARLPLVAAVRVLRTWDLFQPFRQAQTAEARPDTLARAGVVAFWLLAPFAVLGLVALRRRPLVVALLLAPAVAATVTSVLGYGLPRFRHAAEVPLVAAAAVGVLRLTGPRPSEPAGHVPPEAGSP